MELVIWLRVEWFEKVFSTIMVFHRFGKNNVIGIKLEKRKINN